MADSSEPAFLFLYRKGAVAPVDYLSTFATAPSPLHQKMRLIGIEPTHAAPEATALSTELQTHLLYNTTLGPKIQVFFSNFSICSHNFASQPCFFPW